MKFCAWLRALALALALLSCLGSLFVLPASAAEAEETVDEEYEAKKAAYREKIKENDVTTDDLLIGSRVSFYPFRDGGCGATLSLSAVALLSAAAALVAHKKKDESCDS